jgi:hypothetical protein
VAVYLGQRVDLNERYDEDFIWGGRVSHTIPERYRIGLSFLKEDDEDGNDFREEGGVDLWVSAAQTANLQGISSYNFETGGWMEHSYFLNLGPYKDFRVSVSYSLIDYEDFFSKADLSAFSPVSLDPKEEMQQVGASVDYTFKGSYTVTPEYRNYSYDIMGDADYYGATLRYLSGGYAAGASFHRMDGENDRLRYYQVRTYASKTFGKADFTLDFFDVLYDEDINGEEMGLALVGALGYTFSETMRAGVDLEYAQNPFFDNELKAFFKFHYTFKRGYDG